MLFRSCLPTQPERLYSYQSASPLHTRGGYAEFLKDHPSAVDEIAKRIKQNRAKWKAELSQYQRAWSTDTLIIADAAKLCYISSSKLAWGALCREYGIVNFCKQYVNKHRPAFLTDWRCPSEPPRCCRVHRRRRSPAPHQSNVGRRRRRWGRA